MNNRLLLSRYPWLFSISVFSVAAVLVMALPNKLPYRLGVFSIASLAVTATWVSNQRQQFSITSDAVAPETVKHLLTLVQGDKTAAKRLVNSVQKSNPGRSPQWIFDRAIEDLIRDRR